MSKLNTIMLIDDDEIYHYLCKKVIGKIDPEIRFLGCMAAAEALDYLKSAAMDKNKPLPDLILLDINMPGEDGWDFLEQYDKIKARFKKEIIIYMLSTSVFEQDKQRAATYKEVSGYISKPFTPETLKEVKDRHFR